MEEEDVDFSKTIEPPLNLNSPRYKHMQSIMQKFDKAKKEAGLPSDFDKLNAHS